MKKLIYSFVGLFILTNSFAQEAADKKVQAGLILGSGLAIQKVGTNYIATNGVGSDLTIGANVNFGLTETIAFTTGAEFDFSTLKYKADAYKGNNVYYWYNDREILELNEVDGTNANNQLFELMERRQKAVYLTIPTMLTFRTNFIGYFRYFGKFGLRNSFLLKSSSFDKGYDLNPNSPDGTKSGSVNLDEMKAPGEMFFFKSAVGLAGGAEWNFTGSTCLMAEIGFYYGFTPLHTNRNIDKDNNYLFAATIADPVTSKTNFNNKATQSQLMFKLSILF